MKHVEIDFHSVQNRSLNKSLQVAFILRKDQLTYAFIKPLLVAQFNFIYLSIYLRKNCGYQ